MKRTAAFFCATLSLVSFGSLAFANPLVECKQSCRKNESNPNLRKLCIAKCNEEYGGPKKPSPGQPKPPSTTKLPAK